MMEVAEEVTRGLESASLFGMIGELDQTKTLFTLVSLVGVLLVLEIFLEMVEYFAEDAGYSRLLQKLYKEMMIMGCISFFVFIIFNSPLKVEHDENYLAFEFAHILLFFLAFFFVLRACLAVHYTRKAKTYFQSAHNTTAIELCQSFIEAEKKPYSLEAFSLRYLGLMSSIERTFEYRVLEDYFFREFPLIPEEFRFVDYLSKSFKFYTIDMVEIEPRSWLFLVFLVLLNYVRLVFLGSVFSHDLCDDYHSSEKGDDHHDDHDDDHRRLGGGGGEEESLIHTCPDYVMWYSIVIGFALVLATIVVCVITHIQKERLMKLAGVSTAEDRVKKLKDFQEKECVEEMGKHKEFEQLSIELSSRIKSRTSVWQKMGKGSFSSDSNSKALPTTDLDANDAARSPRRLSMRQDSLLFSKNEPERLRLKSNGLFDEDDKYYVSTLVVALGAVQRQHMKHHQEFAHVVLFWLKSFSSCFLWNCMSFHTKSPKPQINHNLLEAAKDLRRNSVNIGDNMGENVRERRESMSSAGSHDERSCPEDDELLSHPLLQSVDSIFLFGSRHKYKNFIQLILMLDAFYLSLYVTNLISVSLESDRPILFNVLFISTFFVMTTLASYLLVMSSILFCVTSLHNKGTEWMCEQEEIKRKVLPLLRHEMLSFLKSSDDVEAFFSIISGDGDITLTDFSNFLYTLGIHPSQKEIRALFRAVDADGSGAIDLDELKTLLFEPSKAFGRNLDDSHSHHHGHHSKLKDSLSFSDVVANNDDKGKNNHMVVKALSTSDIEENGHMAMTSMI